MTALNVLGTPLVPLLYRPGLTGYYRDGCCNTDEHDHGTHVICARVTQAFLDFSSRGATTSSRPGPSNALRGCAPTTAGACALRWKEAYEAGGGAARFWRAPTPARSTL